jgi:hypothetical protein
MYSQSSKWVTDAISPSFSQPENQEDEILLDSGGDMGPTFWGLKVEQERNKGEDMPINWKYQLSLVSLMLACVVVINIMDCFDIFDELTVKDCIIKISLVLESAIVTCICLAFEMERKFLFEHFPILKFWLARSFCYILLMSTSFSDPSPTDKSFAVYVSLGLVLRAIYYIIASFAYFVVRGRT